MLLQFTIHVTQECKVEKKKILMIALASYERYDTSILSCHNMAKSFIKLHFKIQNRFEKCHLRLIWIQAKTIRNLKITQPDNPVYRFLKLTGIQIAFLLRCIVYVRKFLCLMEFGIPSFFKVRSVTPVEVLNPMRSMCYSRCTYTVLRTWMCTAQYGNIGLEVSYFGFQNKFRL